LDQVVDSPRKKENIQQYFQADAKGLVNLKRWEGSFRTDIMVAAHTMLRFSLLDKLLDAFEFPVCEGLSQMDRCEFPAMTEKMEEKVRNLIYFMII
jgi:hypothetical protein